jgi:hypothetical protein
MATTSDRVHATGKINVEVYQPGAYDEPADGPGLFRIHVERSSAATSKARELPSSCRPRRARARRVSSESSA